MRLRERKLYSYVLHDHIICRDAISGYKKEGLGVDVVNLADLSACDFLQAMLLDFVTLACACDEPSFWLQPIRVWSERVHHSEALLTLRIDLSNYGWNVCHVELCKVLHFLVV